MYALGKHSSTKSGLAKQLVRDLPPSKRTASRHSSDAQSSATSVLAPGQRETAPGLRETWLRPLTGPDPVFTALATTEPGSGSDSASIATRARTVDGGYQLNGQKAWISNAGPAQGNVVFAKTDPSQRSRGVTAFLLPRETEGMEFGAPMKKMGQRAIVCREIFFSDAFVPTQNRLGEEGQGFHGLMRTFDIYRVVLRSECVAA